MKGLLYKDWSMIVGSYKINFVFLLIFYGLITVMTQMTFLGYAMVFVVGMYASSTIAMDENSHWDAYARTLPVSPRQIVAVKYLLTLVLTLAGTVLAGLLLLLIPKASAPALEEAAAGLAAAVLVTLVYFSVSMPLSYQFGAAKARSWVTTALLILVFVPAFLFMALPETVQDAFASSLGVLSDQAAGAGLFGVQAGLLIAAALVVLALAVTAVSYLISVRMYTKKSF